MSGKLPVPNPTDSFWLTSPHHLASYRSSDTTPEKCDIAIIGTGLSGVATAYHILKECEGGPEPKIVLFEARQACSGATGRNGETPRPPYCELFNNLPLTGGHIKTLLPRVKGIIEKYGTTAGEEFIAWIASQRIAIKNTAEKEGIDCDLLVTRSFDAYFDPKQASEIKDFLDEQRQAGAVWTQDIQWFEGLNLERVSLSYISLNQLLT